MDLRAKKVNILFCVSFLLFLLLFVSCKEKSNSLEISDLKFEQVDMYRMIYNDKDILADYQVDTMFLIDLNADMRILNSSRFSFQAGTVGYYVYDGNGRILEEQRITLDFPNNKFQYDSVGLLKETRHRSDFYERQEIRYRFVPDSLLLYQYRYFDLNNPPAYEIQFKFDKQGKVLEEIAGWIDDDSRSKTVYEYNQSGKLIYTQSASYKIGEKEDDSSRSHRHYFYTNNKLDSIYNVLPIELSPSERPIKLYYDDRGLCYRQDDGRRIISCIYKQREIY